MLRLDRLRTIVPHAEKPNIATFLEQVYNHIADLEQEIGQLRTTVVEHDTQILELEKSPGDAPNLHLASVMVKEGGNPVLQVCKIKVLHTAFVDSG